jgi:hypothetical protein
MASDQKNEQRAGDAEDDILRRLLATPPDHKQSEKSKASPKKRGRPSKKSKP